MSKKKKLFLNTIIPFVLQILTIASGFIVPALRLGAFGSDVNGLLNSIAKFLSLIGFLEFGVGAVIKSAFYEPLANNDILRISQITSSGNKFFKRIALALLIYIAILCAIYPLIISTQFPKFYTIALILISSISLFAQYYFGIIDRLLLTADQKGYIQYTLQCITIVLNILVWVVLTKLRASIHITFLVSSVVYLITPIYLRIYVNRNYQINRNEKYAVEPIKQKWNGVAQHIAAVILDDTDSIVLTVFATLSDVSVYSVYQMVVLNVKNLFLSMMNGIQAVFGELLAKKEYEKLKMFFGDVEWIVHTATILTFGCTSVLLLPFVSIYTQNITDAEYYQPLFSALIAAANAGHCLRLPYNTMILAAGHFKQTQSNYIIAATVNVASSIVLVKQFGLIGVALGTLIAMLFQTIWMAVYNSKHIIFWPIKSFLKQFVIDCVIVAIAYPVSGVFSLLGTNYLSWIILAVEKTAVWIVVSLFVNVIFYRDKLIRYSSKLYKKIVKQYKRF